MIACYYSIELCENGLPDSNDETCGNRFSNKNLLISSQVSTL
jgi:hypothetical protein